MPTAVFEGPLPRRKTPFDYRLQVTWADGHNSLLADPYRIGPLIGEQDLYYLGEGSHLRPFEVLGAHPMTLGEGVYTLDGVRFAVWAPNASRVSVVGDFNGWDGRRHTMRSRGPSGIWELFVPHAAPGDRYRYEIRTRDGVVLPLKSDPYARAAQMRPESASVVAGPLPPRQALPAGRAEANARHAPVSIYEVHLGSWRRHPDGRFHDWDELAAALPAYAADLGFTHLELLPITEHPFDGSWGYQTLGMYAPTARFGDAAGFQRFVAGLPRRRPGPDPGLGAGALPDRRLRPGAVRRHGAVRIRRPARRFPPGLEHADLPLRPPRGAQLPGRQRAVLDRAHGRRRPARGRRGLDALPRLLAPGRRVAAQRARRAREPGGHRAAASA